MQREHEVTVDIAESEKFALGTATPAPRRSTGRLDRPGLIRRMLDVVPNPWQGARILDNALARLRKRADADEQMIINARLTLIEHIERRPAKAVGGGRRSRCSATRSSGDIVFKLLARRWTI